MIEKAIGIWQLNLNPANRTIVLRSDKPTNLGRVVGAQDGKILTKSTIYTIKKENRSPYGLSDKEIRRLDKALYEALLAEGIVDPIA